MRERRSGNGGDGSVNGCRRHGSGAGYSFNGMHALLRFTSLLLLPFLFLLPIRPAEAQPLALQRIDMAHVVTCPA